MTHIGSGTTPLIGPLVPWEINKKNQLIGKSVYQKILNYSPDIALINEQAFSSNLIPIYLESGYKTIIMEWNNSFSFKIGIPELEILDKVRFHNVEKLMFWNNSINFQSTQVCTF